MPRKRQESDEIPNHILHPRVRRSKPFLLFHWSPRSRRRSIKKNGLVVGSRHSCHSAGWRADYICFSEWPVFAWTYSAGTTRIRQEWDLWVVRSDKVGKITRRWDMKGTPAELRAWQNIPASDVCYVATREHRPRNPTKPHGKRKNHQHRR